jgi:MFS family permease
LIRSEAISTIRRDWNPFWISLSCGLYWFAFSLTRPIFSVYAHSKGIDGFELGAVLAVYALLPLLAAIPGGFLADAVGRTNVLRAGAALMVASGAAYLYADGLWMLILAQMLAGVGQMAVWLAVQVLITGGSKEGREGRFATFSLYMALGQMIAPILAGFLSDRYGFQAVFLGYLVINLLLLVGAWQCRDDEYAQRKKAMGKNRVPHAGSGVRGMAAQIVRLVRNLKFAVILLTTFIAMFIMDVRSAFLPVYLDSRHMSHMQIGMLVSVGAFVRPIYPRLMRTFGFRSVLIMTYAVSLLLLFVVPLLQGFSSLAVLIFVTGLALGVNQPLTLSMVANYTDPNERGLGIGLRLMANRASQLIDPLLFGVFSVFVGIRGAFVLVGAVLAIFCLGTIWLFMKAEKISADNQPA